MIAPASAESDHQAAGALRKDLRAIVVDGAAYSVMVGIGETYLPAFALAVGIGGVSAGLISTLPWIAGAVLQLCSPAAVSRLQSHRKWVVLCAATQAVSFLPLIGAAIVGRLPAWAAFLIAAIYWGAGMGAGPAWNTWVATLVPARIRASYFARRTRIAQACVLTGFLAGGAILQAGAKLGSPVRVFALLFAAAGICRFISVSFLVSQREPRPLPEDQRRVSAREILRRIRGGGDGRFLLCLVAMQMSVQLAAPYFTPFMLAELKLSYTRFVILIGTAFVAKIMMLPTLGSFARRLGTHRLLWLGGFGVVPLSALWMVSQDFFYLLALQLVAGAFWAAYELATSLMYFEAIPDHERTSVLTTFNLAHALATVSGSLLGGAVLKGLGAGWTGYMTVFGVSAAARLVAALLIRTATIPDVPAVPVAMQPIAVRPSAGSIDRPILPIAPAAGEKKVSGRIS